MTFALGKKSLKKLEGVHPHLVSVVLRAIKITKVDFTVICGLRTEAQQVALYAQGRTTPGKIVTWTMDSRHLTGHAVDLGAWVNGTVSWDEVHYPKIAAAMLQAAAELKIPLVWAGSWKKKNKELVHFELNRKYYP